MLLYCVFEIQKNVNTGCLNYATFHSFIIAIIITYYKISFISTNLIESVFVKWL